ncbi:MAG: DUF86 domain-containing protein [Candidatus Rokubacteria bacterium]|nr:DUF86 domain-containing protein [Candidatus Rokubacteria bacterium]
MKEDSVYLKHIRDAIARVESYTAGGPKSFFQNTMVQDAVIRNLEVIGEAVRNLSPQIRRRHPEIPWRSITALRNVLIHEYFGVDLQIVWRVVTRRLPTLKRSVDRLLASKR